MEFFLDTVNLEEITHYQKVLPLAGVTSNPTILKAAGNIDFFTHLQAVKERMEKHPYMFKWLGKPSMR